MDCAKLTQNARGNRSIRQFASETELAPSYISGIEKGKYQPSLQVIIKICDASQKRVTLTDFLGQDVNNKAEKLYEFCMKLIKDESERDLLKMYYETL